MIKYLALSVFFVTAIVSAGEVDELVKSAKLIFEDDFNRTEKDDTKEELGKQWVTNSKQRAKGVKQCDLTGEHVKITMAKVADHGVSMRHDAPFHNGIILSRFKINDPKGMSFNFNDPAAKKVTWAGHIAGINLKPGKLTIEDHITGKFDLKIREMRQGKDAAKKKEAAKILKEKQKVFKSNISVDKWYEIAIVFQGAKASVFIDGNKAGEFESEGLNHKVKQNIAFAVSGTVEIDYLKIYTLD